MDNYDLIDDLTAELDVDFSDNEKYTAFIDVSGTEKIHKTTLCRAFFDKNNKYHCDRILNCARKISNIRSNAALIDINGSTKCVAVNDNGVTLFVYKKRLCLALIAVKSISVNNAKQFSVSLETLQTDANDVRFTVFLCSRICFDDDNNVFWGGLTIKTEYKIPSKQILFPAWKDYENTDIQNHVLVTSIPALQNLASHLLEAQKENTVYPTTTSTLTGLPYDESLSFSLNVEINSKRKKHKSNYLRKNTATTNTMPTTQRLECQHGDCDSVKIPITDMVHHQLRHIVSDEQDNETHNDVNDQSCALFPCFLCGKHSESGCNIKCTRKTSKKPTMLVSYVNL